MKVKSVKKTGEFEAVFNLEVEDTHNFILENGMIVHNCYDSLGYGLISRHAQKSKDKYKEELTKLQKHKQKLCKDTKRRRYY